MLAVVTAAVAIAAAAGSAGVATTPAIVYQHGPSLVPTTQIWAVNPDGSGAHRLISKALDGLVDPRWSQGGKRITFLNDARAAQIAYVTDANGKNRKRLLPTSVAGSNGVDLSPNGKLVAFTGEVGTTQGLYIVGASGRKPRLLVRVGLNHLITAPAFSPNGKQILYTVAGFDGRTNLNSYTLWSVAPDGSHRHRVHALGASFGASDLFILAADWSPDGSQIAAPTGTNGGGPDTDGAQIEVMNADGSGSKVLTSLPGWNWYPSWSPDAKQIAFASSSANGASSSIQVMNADGSGVKRITRGPFDVAPSWRR
jgi:Tol biopolymer transport system component